MKENMCGTGEGCVEKSIDKYELQARLIRWAREHPADFPWRKRISRFHALTVEILLQRTKAVQVVPVFHRFRKSFPTARDLASSRITTVRSVIRPLGLIWRAEFLKSLGREIIKTGNRIPEAYDDLLALPGVGPYAASAYLSLHRGIRKPIIDSNTVRLYCRLLGHSYDGETRRKRWVYDVADAMTPQEWFRAFNYALLDFTREVCKPKPECDRCPLTDICLGFRDR